MKKVIVSVTNDLVTDQRVQRVCQSLYDWGYNVLLIGRQLPESPDVKRPYPCRRMKLLFKRKFFFYAEYNLRLFLLLLFNKADILLANDLDTLPANFLAAKIKHSRLIFDSHEYFAETPEVYKRVLVKAFWLLTERMFVPRCDAYYTVSHSVAVIFRKKYNMEFKVIRNVPFRYAKTGIGKEVNPYIIYQGSINKGRGLELMMKALAMDSRFRVVIAGDGPELKNLKQIAMHLQLQNRIRFTGRLLPEELKEITSGALVGISIEEPIGTSYISSLPNKLFDYIQAGIPVLVSDLPEMKAIVNQYQVGMILEERTPDNLLKILEIMMNDKARREVWKLNLEKAAETLCWENESLILKELFDLI